MTRAGDLVEFRIDAVLKDMAKTCLCELPGDEPWTVEKFLDRTQVHRRSVDAQTTLTTFVLHFLHIHLVCLWHCVTCSPL